MRFSIVAFVVLVLGGITMAEAPTPTFDLSTPKSADVAYLKAYYAASEEGMRATSTGGDLAFDAVWSARCGVVQWQRISDAAVQRFGQGALKTINAPDFSDKNLEKTLKKISETKVAEDGDHARVGPNQHAMLRVNGEWRRNLRDGDAPNEQVRNDHYRWSIKRNKALAEAFAKLAAEVSDGKYAAVVDVENAMKKAITETDAKIPPPSLTTQPAPAATTKP